jgi:hypothetical protein
MGHPWIKKSLALVTLLSLIAPAAGWAADDTTATPAASLKSHKRHHRNKNKSSDGVTHANTVAPAAAGSGTEKGNLNAAGSGMSDSLGPNNPATPNMGSPDHVPGTTGSSGQ